MRKRRNKLNPQLFSLICSFSLILILSLVFSLAVMNTENPVGNIGVATIMLFPVTGALSALFTSFFKGGNAIREGIISSLSLSLIMIALGLVFSKGALPIGVILNSLILTVSNLFVSYLARGRRRRKRR